MQPSSDITAVCLRGLDLFYVILVIIGLTSVFFAIIVGLTETTLLSAANPNRTSLAVLFSSILVLNGSVFLAVKFVLIRVRKISWQSLSFIWPGTGWIVGAIVLGIILVATIEGIEQTFDISASQLTSLLIAPDGFSWFGLIGGVLLIGLLAPLGEELFFRGLIYRCLRDLWRPLTAAPVSAILFASAHFYYPISCMLMVAFIGLVLAIAYERSGSMWVPISIHAAQNTTVVILIYMSLP